VLQTGILCENTLHIAVGLAQAHSNYCKQSNQNGNEAS